MPILAFPTSKIHGICKSVTPQQSSIVMNSILIVNGDLLRLPFFPFPSRRFLMAEGIIQFEVEITDMARIRSRVSWPDSSGPWIEGGLEDLMVHFAYACWSAYRLGHAVSLALAKTGKRIAARMAMMAITTSSSIRVKARFAGLPARMANHLSLPSAAGSDWPLCRSQPEV